MPLWDEKDVFFHKSSIRHYNKSMTMKTTTNTGKNQIFRRKVREGSVEAI